MEILDGNTEGLKTAERKRLEAVFRRRVKKEELISWELTRYLAALSQELHRQIGVLIDRSGEIKHTIIGDASRLYLPDIGRARGAFSRLRGLRLIRTELRKQGLTREDLADLSKLRLDAVVAIEVDHRAEPRSIHYAYLRVVQKNLRAEEHSVQHFRELPTEWIQQLSETETALNRWLSGSQSASKNINTEGRALLIGVFEKTKTKKTDAEASMEELKELARTARVEVLDSIIQYRQSLDPRTLMGEGKTEELTLRALDLGADIIIFDRNLSPSQLRAITQATDLKVLDRTQLILDIFAKHAKSRDGKLQVELAQLKYLLPRLIEKSTAMSRLTGGIGGQGPGETKLELHRRRARERIHRLEQEILELGKQRDIRRQKRQGAGLPVVSIVGYTNAGKSTLLNALTKSDVIAENKLFATLDPTTRRLRFPEAKEIILTDTVGFIRDLPLDLINAFKATLEELSDASLLLHVVDASDSRISEKMTAVETILKELSLDQIPRVTVLNKCDVINRQQLALLKHGTQGIAVSALKKEGLDLLMHRLSTLFPEKYRHIEESGFVDSEVIHEFS